MKMRLMRMRRRRRKIQRLRWVRLHTSRAVRTLTAAVVVAAAWTQ